MKDNNKNRIYAAIAVGVLFLLLIGSTFAYFAAQGGDASQTDVNILTHTVDSLVFETGDALSITADQNTFAMGKGNQTDSTFARATLKANSSTNQAKDHYYVYLSIDENTFEYTTTEKTAELILTVNKVEGETKTPVTTIQGLNYVTVGSVSGFDITEYDDLITIASNYEITSTGTKIDEWEVTLTLVNLDSNQSSNAGKVLKGTLLIQKEMVASQYITSLFTTQGANHLYHHDGTITDSEGNVIDAEDGSYRYAGGDYNAEDLTTLDTRIFSEVNVKTGDENEILYYYTDDFKDKEPGYVENVFELFVRGFVNDENLTEEEVQILTDFNLKVEDGTYVMFSTVEEAMRDAYYNRGMKEGKINNYVCFGSDEEKCPKDNLYRIIGVIDNKVKLIKATRGNETTLGMEPHENGEYYWSGSSDNTSNIWTTSTLNTDILNGIYLTTLGKKWSKKIATTEWKIGGNTFDIYYNISKIAYQKEVVDAIADPNGNKTINAKVGLMYVSDYGFAASPANWTTKLISYSNDTNINNNWMLLLNCSDWTISRESSDSSNAFYVSSVGYVGTYAVSSVISVRPVFYLESSATFTGGTGTASDPYRIA